VASRAQEKELGGHGKPRRRKKGGEYATGERDAYPTSHR
jgi:hypothetical protein